MKKLPIHEAADEIIAAVTNHQVTVLVGETGSGKTTQVPLILHSAGFAKRGMIGITQPRRLAVTSVATHVASLIGKELGTTVGYKIRFHAMVSSSTAIKFMTSGILLREMETDPLLKKYSVIIIDEAHERSLEIDLLLGLLKRLLTQRPDLRIVVMSATIAAEKFVDFFGGRKEVSHVAVKGRSFPVEVVYLNKDLRSQEVVPTVVKMVSSLHKSKEVGDILVFMTGKDDISIVIKELAACQLEGGVIIPLYGGVESVDPLLVFGNVPGKRKILVATNIAETSLTVEGVKYVVDTGYVKQSNFHPKAGIESLDVVMHSKAGCEQRTGRAGRTNAGICYRLYSAKNFAERPEFTMPEIQRVSLAKVVLITEKLGIREIENFDFIDVPDRQVLREAYHTLMILGAIDWKEKKITELGVKMSDLPLEPRLARMVVEAMKVGCVKSVVAFAALQTVSNLFARPRGKEREADLAHSEFKNPKSDVLTLLNVWNRYRASGQSPAWCHAHFLNARVLEEAMLVNTQILDILEQSGIPVQSITHEEVVLRCIASSLIYNLLEHDSRHKYQAIFHQIGEVHLHPFSLLNQSTPRFVVATQLIRTRKLYARDCTAVPPEWLAEFLPQLFRYGPPSLILWEKGDEYVQGEQPILFRQKSVGSRKVRVPLEMARRLNSESELLMAKAGKVTLRFEGADEVLVAKHQGGEVQLSNKGKIKSVEPGIPYRCQITYMGPIPFAEPLEKVLDLGEDILPTLPRNEVGAEQVKSLAGDLAASWEAAFNR
jgi:HrpA-like RNA helicase